MQTARKDRKKTRLSYQFKPDIENTPEPWAYEMVRECTFIDKTRMYRKLSDSRGRALRLQFPRRFGKTTALSFLRNSLSIPTIKNDHYLKETIGEFVERLKTLDDGDEFLKKKLRPVIFVSLSDVTSEDGLKAAVQHAFLQNGIFVNREDGVNVMLRDGIASLRNLWIEAGSQVDVDVDDKVMVLIDEYDAPLRKMANSNEDKMVEVLCTLSGTLKTQLDDQALGTVIIVSLLSLSKIGLSDLNYMDISHDPEYHGITGIKMSELERALQNAYNNENIKLDAEEAFRIEAKKFDKDPKANDKLDIGMIGDDGVWEYLKSRYDGFRFCLWNVKESQWAFTNLEALFAPQDVYHFSFAIGLIDLKVKEWCETWSEGVLDVVLRFTKDTTMLQSAFVGGTLAMSDIENHITLDEYRYPRQDNVQLLRLYLELGFLSIHDIDQRGVVLRPTHAVRLATITGTFWNRVYKKTGVLSSGILRDTLEALKTPILQMDPEKPELKGTFDYALYRELNFVKELIAFRTQAGRNADLYREYEVQHQTMHHLRMKWECGKQPQVRVLQEVYYEHHDGNKRIDITCAIMGKIHKVGIEIKYFVTETLEARSVRTQLNTAWGQATQHVEKPLFQDCGFKSVFGIVFCMNAEGKMAILVRRTALSKGDQLDENEYDEFALDFGQNEPRHVKSKRHERPRREAAASS